MARGIHDILEFRMKNNVYSTKDILTAHISYSGFVLMQSSDYKEVVLEFAKEMQKMLHIFPVPTLNPFMDELDKYNTDDGLECLCYYIKEKMSVINQEKVDNLRDVVKIEVPFDIILVNAIPILDNESLTIEKGTIQTLFYRREIKGDE